MEKISVPGVGGTFYYIAAEVCGDLQCIDIFTNSLVSSAIEGTKIELIYCSMQNIVKVLQNTEFFFFFCNTT